MNLKQRSLAAWDKKNSDEQKSRTSRVQQTLEKTFTVDCKDITVDGEFVLVSIGTDDELRFRNSSFNYDGSTDIMVWHNGVWQNIYSIQGLGHILSTEETSEVTSPGDDVVEALESLIYGIVEELFDGR